LIEHSYKADSDLSPAGWEYAERLKAAVTARRKAARVERADKIEINQEENPLIVSPPPPCIFSLDYEDRKKTADDRYGHQLVDEHTTPHGHSSNRGSKSFRRP
jgi:hypothetical protein